MDPGHPALRHGMPVGPRLRAFRDFVVAYDPRTRNPLWALEHFTRDSTRGPGDRAVASFQEDRGIPARFRSKLSDFQRSGFDRGHMVPAATHRGSQGALEETFTLSNVSPQVGRGFNRDYWARFEHFVKGLARGSAGVFVVTGPLFVPHLEKGPLAGAGGTGWRANHALLGAPPELVAVPTHFFKVVLVEPGGEDGKGTLPAVGAFVMPNEKIDPKRPLSDFIVPVGALEAVAGLEFFPEVLREGERAALDSRAVELGTWGGGGAPAIPGLSDGSGRPLALLPSPAVVDGAPPTSAAAGEGAAGAPKPAAAAAAFHLCDQARCDLPPPNFWEKAGKAAHRG